MGDINLAFSSAVNIGSGDQTDEPESEGTYAQDGIQGDETLFELFDEYDNATAELDSLLEGSNSDATYAQDGIQGNETLPELFDELDNANAELDSLLEGGSSPSDSTTRANKGGSGLTPHEPMSQPNDIAGKSAGLRPGDSLNVVGPLGRGFTFDPSWRRVLMLARGVGLATMAPLVTAAVAAPAAAPVAMP